MPEKSGIYSLITLENYYWLLYFTSLLYCNSNIVQWSSYNCLQIFQSVAQKGERIREEEVKCQAMADVAQADLDEALPALEEANKVNADN